MTSNCTRYQDDLKAYRDGELPLLRRALVRRHLTHCASCQEEIQAMTQMTEDLRATEPEDALSPSLREKILTAPDASEAGAGFAPAQTRASKRPRKRLIPTWGYAALALVAWFVCFPLFQKAREQTQVASSSAPTASMRQMKVFKPTPQTVAAAKPVQPPMPDIPSPETASDRPPPPPKMKPMRAAPLSLPVSVHAVAAPGAPPSPDTVALNGDPDSLRQVHKEASIGIQVPNPDATGDMLNNMVKETGGYVAANNLTTGDDGTKSGELIVKVPEAQFETFLAAVAKLGVVQSKSITGEDITEKTSDAHEAQGVEESDLAQAEARLKSLGKHATWEDKENTQDQRVKLAETRARLKLLKRMAALGTLTIDLSETPKGTVAPPVTNGFTGTLKATTHDALQSLVGSAGALLALVIWLLAYSPIWVPLLLVGRYALKEYKKREAAV